MRAKRLSQWILTIIVAIALIFGENAIKQAFFTEKTPITVYAPKSMESAFKKALSASSLSNCKIVITEDKTKADITVDYGKEDDSRYMQFAFSPFVIAYNTDDDRFKELKNAEVLVSSEYNKKLYEIDFLKVIDEVIEEGKWKNLGVKESVGTIRLFYPAETTEYWHDFYNFMLVTVNGGKYPETSIEMNKAVEYIERFTKSQYTEAVTDFDERLNRTDGFSENCIYVMPEAITKQLSYDKSEYVRLIFPLQTTYMYYYVIGNTDNGKSVVNAINGSDFFYKLKSNNYRSTEYYELGDVYRSVYDERDVYNIAPVPKKNFFTGGLEQ